MGVHAENTTIKNRVESGQFDAAGIQSAHGFQKKFVWTFLTAAMVLASIYVTQVRDAEAGLSSSVIRVSAVVMARTQLTTVRQPAMFVVTDADVQRGYVDVIGASAYELWNNDPSGCVLTFLSTDFPYQEAFVTVMGRQFTVYPTGGMIFMPLSGRQEIALNYRFILTNEAQPGTYAWPLSIFANPR